MYMHTMHLYQNHTHSYKHNNHYYNRGTILQCYTNDALYDFFLHTVFSLVKELFLRSLKKLNLVSFFKILNWLLADVTLEDPFFHCMFVVQIGSLCMDFFQHVIQFYSVFNCYYPDLFPVTLG